MYVEERRKLNKGNTLMHFQQIKNITYKRIKNKSKQAKEKIVFSVYHYFINGL